MTTSRSPLGMKSYRDKVCILDKNTPEERNHPSVPMKDVGIRSLILQDVFVYFIQPGLSGRQKQCYDLFLLR